MIKLILIQPTLGWMNASHEMQGGWTPHDRGNTP